VAALTPAEAAIARFIRGEGGSFDALLALAEAEAAAGGPPRSRLGAEPVPVALFKELDLGPAPALPGDVIFRTSGTTGQVRGVRRSRHTELYDLGAVLHARARVPELPARIVSLCPTYADSSLGHMLTRLGDVQPCFVDGQVRTDTWDRLADGKGPVFLATTAFALDALLALPGRAHLDPRSVVMVTGGFKGRRVRLDAPDLYRALPDRLGTPRVVGEYGMTELSSQLWTDPVPCGELPGVFVAPRWLRVRAADPLSGEDTDGEGVLRFWDLANAGGVLAIETQDLGRVVPNAAGDRVELRGRLEGAELRGCSLRAERVRDRAEGEGGRGQPASG
jgi:acyl-CoA synthetase (AMP-forming)/AMP-acid ligase II